MNKIAWCNGEIFSNGVLTQNKALITDAKGCFIKLVLENEIPSDYKRKNVSDFFLCPGYLDLQVNGGGGILFNDEPTLKGLEHLAQTHRKLGCQGILPTLITDQAEKTTQAIAATISAQKAGIREIKGLHLEGPHISVSKKGAHLAKYIRPLTKEDIHQLIKARENIEFIKITFAPENVTISQAKTLVENGITLSLGHSDCDYNLALEYFDAGVTLATHLFNAMSSFTHREEGLVGAILYSSQISAGIIADGIHVNNVGLKIATALKPDNIFLVSDCMSVAGTQQTEFMLNKRMIIRKHGALRLKDGTLAGADLDLLSAMRYLHQNLGIEPSKLFSMTITLPQNIINGAHKKHISNLEIGAPILAVKKDFSHQFWLHN